MTDSNRDKRFADLRDMAEKRVNIQNIDLASLDPEDIKKLFHELRTHQIELEVQNEELRQAQQELQQSRDAFSDLYEFAPVGYATLDQNAVITRANLTLAKLLGITRGEMIGKPLTRFIERADQDAYYHFLRQIEKQPGEHEVELRAVTQNHKTPLYLQIRSLSEEAGSGVPAFHRLAFVDVTARRGAEAALHAAYNDLERLVAIRTAELRESEARFRSMADSAPVMIWVANDSGQRTFVNQTWQDFSGRPASADIGHGWTDLIHPEDVEHVTAAYRNAIRVQRVIRLEYRLRRHDGAYRWVYEVGVPTQADIPSRDFIGSAIDITDRKEAQQRLELALANSRELYRISRHISTLSTPRDILKTLVQSRYLANCSRAAIKIFNQPWGEERPETATVVAMWQPGGISVLPEHPLNLAELGYYQLCRREAPVLVADIATDPRINDRYREVLQAKGTRSLLVHPLVASGEWFGVLVLHSREPYDADNDTVTHIRGLVDQAAAALHTTQQLSSEARARRLAEEANQLKIQFLAMISHELRTPLTSIQGYADTMLMDDVSWDEAQQREFIETIRDESENLRELIEQLLDLSRLEAGMFAINTSMADSAALIEEVYPQLQIIAANHDLQLEVEGDLPELMVDMQRVEQVITNLVHNAAKFSPPGSLIAVRARAHEDGLEISVADEGPGIPRHQHSQVFEAFRQAGGQDSRKGGAGLGLAICKGIVHAHGGEIWIEDHAPPGLTVVFALPGIED